jgi:propanol-preferring alcohol dehydrogenase
LTLELGAEKWIDFRESQNIIADVMAATDGAGPHAAIVSAAAVSPALLIVGLLSLDAIF